MPGAYDDLMKALSDYEKSGAPARDAEKARKRKADEEAAARKAEEDRLKAAEKEGGVGARVREGFDRMQEMRDAAGRELKARPYKKPEGGVNGVRG